MGFLWSWVQHLECPLLKRWFFFFKLFRRVPTESIFFVKLQLQFSPSLALFRVSCNNHFLHLNFYEITCLMPSIPKSNQTFSYCTWKTCIELTIGKTRMKNWMTQIFGYVTHICNEFNTWPYKSSDLCTLQKVNCISKRVCSVQNAIEHTKQHLE